MKVMTVDPTIKSAAASEAMYRLLIDLNRLSTLTPIIVVKLPKVVKIITVIKAAVKT